MTDDQNGKAKDLLDWLGARATPDFTKARWFGAGVGLVLALFFALAMLAAGLVMIHTIGQAMTPEAQGPNLGAGALIAALLGAPFLIWGTWLKYQTVRYQKEGHITDRINKAVEMLGAEKVVKKQLTNSAGKRVYEKDALGEPDFAKPVIVEESVPNIEVRIGAILSLERIALDSTTHDYGRDHVRVMEILCAYVRENAPSTTAKESWRQLWERERKQSALDSASFQAWFCDKYNIDEQKIYSLASVESTAEWARNLPKPRRDVVQALKVIGRRTESQRKVEAAWPNPPDSQTVWPFGKAFPSFPDEPIDAVRNAINEHEKWRESVRRYTGYRLDLSGINLQAIDLSPKRPDTSDAVFSGAILRDARMEGANLRDVNLQGAILSAGRFDCASFSDAKMSLSEIDQAVLRGANLDGTHLEGASLIESNLEDASLFGAWMHFSVLNSSKIDRANLSEARLAYAYLYRAELTGTDLRSTQLGSAALVLTDLRRARLAKTKLHGAFISDAIFDQETYWVGALLDGANLYSLDLSKTTISADQIFSAFGDGGTKLPEGMSRPPHWPEVKLDQPDFRDEWAKWRADPAGYVPPPPPAGQ